MIDASGASRIIISEEVDETTDKDVLVGQWLF